MTIQEYIAFLTRHVTLNPHSKDSILKVDQGGEVKGIGIGSGGTFVTHDIEVKIERESSLNFMLSLVRAAGFEVETHYQLENCYWPVSYMKLRAENPWWLFKTRYGLLKMG